MTDSIPETGEMTEDLLRDAVRTMASNGVEAIDGSFIIGAHVELPPFVHEPKTPAQREAFQKASSIWAHVGFVRRADAFAVIEGGAS